VIVISNEPIMILGLPKPAFAIQQAIHPCRSEGFPSMDDSIERVVRPTFDHHVNVIRHDAPAQQPVPLRIEEKKCIFHQRRDPSVTQKALAGTAVEHLGDPLLLFGLAMHGWQCC
jgi:hypothetical protein